jgi:3-isopropylmalate/(R)-2-methylmalate dehydratase small subunit
VDLARSVLTAPGAREIPFEVNPARREQLLEGLDEVALTLRRADRIAEFEARDRERRPWVYDTSGSAGGGPG